MDCMEFMRGIPDKFFELAVVDPPYGIGVNKMRMGSRKTVKPDKRSWDNEPPSIQYFTELKRISVNMVIWGANHFISRIPFDSSCWLIWDKGETMYNRDFAEVELAYTSFTSPAKIFKLSPNQLTRIHPTQKPVALYEWLLTNYAKQGDKILDTHMGSQSSRIAAWRLGFDYYGCELDKDYFNDGCKRFEQERAKQRLFKPADIVHKPKTLF